MPDAASNLETELFLERDALLERSDGTKRSSIARVWPRSLLRQERKQRLQVGKAVTLAGVSVLQRGAPDKYTSILDLPQAYQIRKIAWWLRSHGPASNLSDLWRAVPSAACQGACVTVSSPMDQTWLPLPCHHIGHRAP